MSRKSTCFLALALLASAGAALAQGPGGGRGPGGRGFGGPPGFGGRFGGADVEGAWMLQASQLLGSAAVQKELGVDEATAEKVAGAVRGGRGPGGRGPGAGGPGGGGFDPEAMVARMKERVAEAKTALEESLNDEQMTRLHQIQRQLGGLMAAVASSEDSKALGVTDDQKGKIDEIQSTLQEDSRELFGQVRDGLLGFDEVRGKMQELQGAAGEQVAALMTDDQKATWKEMTGEDFAALEEVRQETMMRGPGGRGGPGGRRGGNNDA